MQNYQDLQVWHKAHSLTLTVYEATEGFPQSETYGLTNQMRRCSVSIPSNIAEGCGRGGNKELIHFLQISLGSAFELEYQILLAHDLGFMKADTYSKLNNMIIEVKKMLSGLIRSVKSTN